MPSWVAAGSSFLAAILQPVTDFEQHLAIGRGFRLNFDKHRLAAFRHAIFDRVFDDRLQQQGGQPRLQKALRNVNLDLQAVGKRAFFDVEVKPLKVDLLGKRHVCRRVDRQAGAKEGRQRQSMVSARSVRPVMTSDDRLLSVLNRKCGLTW